MRISVFFVGEVQDDGFNACALEGALRAQESGSAEITVIDGVPYDEATIRTRLSEAASGCDGLIFVGGQGNAAMPEVAAAFSGARFAIVQGARLGPNLASYDVLQEESAFLAGALAALVTKTGVVGHLSGHRVRPGLKGRAAFVAGVAHVDSEISVLTGFCGTQDDNTVSRAWAEAEIDAGADIIFTMLNAARRGAIDACRAGTARQIGNAHDWVGRDPTVFVGSAVARIDLGVERAIADMVAGSIPSEIVELGLAQGNYSRLSLAPDVPRSSAGQIEALARLIRDGEIPIPDRYDGPEFQPETGSCAATG